MTWRIQTIRNERLELDILPELGASILGFRAGERPVLRPVKPEDVQTSSQCASFTLMPYSNRIRDARFTFEGETVSLRPTTRDGLSQHGDVRNRPWDVTALSDQHLRATFDSRQFEDINWPWAFTASVDYLLDASTLRMRLRLTNADTRRMPAGMGLHPYFARRLGGIDPTLQFAATAVYDTDERQLPVGAARALRPDEGFRTPAALGERQLDATFTGAQAEAQLCWGQTRVTLDADPIFTHLVVYTAPDGSLALEPTTHATDAFNLAEQGAAGVDRRVLEPGQSLEGEVRIRVEGAGE